MTQTPPDVVARVGQARNLVWAQLGLLLVGLALVIAGAAAQDEATREEARRNAEKVGAGEAAVNSLLGLAGLVSLVLLLVYAPKLVSFASRARQIVLVAEGISVVSAVWAMRGLDPAVIVFELLVIALAVKVISLLRREDVAHEFAVADASMAAEDRFQIKGL